MANVILKGTYEGYQSKPTDNGVKHQIGIKQGLQMKLVTIKPESLSKYQGMKTGTEVTIDCYVGAYNSMVYFKEN